MSELGKFRSGYARSCMNQFSTPGLHLVRLKFCSLFESSNIAHVICTFRRSIYKGSHLVNWKLFRNLDLLCVSSLGPGSGWLDRGHPQMIGLQREKESRKMFLQLHWKREVIPDEILYFLISSFSVRQMKAS